MNFGRCFSVALVVCTSALRTSDDGEAEANTWVSAVSGRDLETGNSTRVWPRPDDEDCKYDQVRRDINLRCKLPNQAIDEVITCFNCGGWGLTWDTHPTCRVACCSKELPPGLDDRCHCLHRGETYDKGWDHRVVNGNNAEKCCGTGPTENGKCGCSELDMQIRYGGKPSDCCSGQVSWITPYTGLCVRKTCGLQGEKPEEFKPCCRVSGETTPMNGDKCGCFHANQSPYKYDRVSESNCCSGSFFPTREGVCGCIEDHKKLPEGANKGDCCSLETEQFEGAEYCRAAKCSEVGSTKAKGHFCCSGKDSGGTCVCIPPGEAITEQGRNCCSGRATDDGKCDYLGKGEKPNLNVTDESVCLSGKVDEEGRCSCLHGGSHSKDALQCCSGTHEKGSEICSCMPIDMRLANGATVSDCCSGTETAGVCTCAAPGAPMPDELGARECCARRSSDGNCGCSGPDDGLIAESVSGRCCGGFFNGPESQCACIQSGYAVASFVHAGACCSGSVGVVDDGHVCE